MRALNKNLLIVVYCKCCENIKDESCGSSGLRRKRLIIDIQEASINDFEINQCISSKKAFLNNTHTRKTCTQNKSIQNHRVQKISQLSTAAHLWVSKSFQPDRCHRWRLQNWSHPISLSWMTLKSTSLVWFWRLSVSRNKERCLWCDYDWFRTQFFCVINLLCKILSLFLCIILISVYVND